jgi:serine/threonine-protein kinase
MYKVIHEPALIPSLLTPDVPPGFEFILARALAKAPEKRYQTAEEMAVDLRRYKELAENDNASWDGTALTRQEPEAERVIDITNADDGTVIREDGSAGQERTIKLARAPAAASTPLETTPAVTSGQPKKRPVVPVAIGLVLLVIAGAVTMLGGKPTGPVQNSAPSEAVSPPLPPSAPAGKATLTFAITPWGEIFIDGVSYGASPPLSDIEVVAGKHHIEIRNTGHKSRVQELEIKHGDAQKIKHKF